jgi:hypothetical protein
MNYPIEKSHMDGLQKFQARLNTEPDPMAVEATPDRKAQTVVISHIEMTLDELFFGQWSTSNFTWSHIANEVQGSLELMVIHPVSGHRLTRIGAASIVITVDKVPDAIKDNPQERNMWALNTANKKANALDLAFPKLKAECLKNAAQSLGKVFGRDINRKNRDAYKPFKITPEDTGLKALPESAMVKLTQAINEGADEYEIMQSLELVAELITPEQKQTIDNLLKSREQ